MFVIHSDVASQAQMPDCYVMFDIFVKINSAKIFSFLCFSLILTLQTISTEIPQVSNLYVSNVTAL